MTPKILFVGCGKGSWQVRGVQLARALGGRCTGNPTSSDWRWADVIVLVKHAIVHFGAEARAVGVPIVWDVLDFWKQPEDNGRSEAELVAEVHRLRDTARVSLLIGATEAMATAIGGVCLPHHSRPGLRPAPVRESVGVVAYEGTPKYLGAWKPALERECAARGWSFVVNPSSLTDADIVVALRDGKWDGEVCRRWKSGVKYVNALAAGRPVVTQVSSALMEIGAVSYAVDQVAEISGAIDHAVELRAAAYGEGVQRSDNYSLPVIAAQCRRLLQRVIRERAA